MTVLIQYAASQQWIMAATDIKAGAPVVLRKLTPDIDSRLVLWTINVASRTIRLAASPLVSPLVLTSPKTASETQLVVDQVDSKKLQNWSTLGNPSVINSVSVPGMVADNKLRNLTDGNPIWLYPNNSSPAQAWSFASSDSEMLAADFQLLEDA